MVTGSSIFRILGNKLISKLANVFLVQNNTLIGVRVKHGYGRTDDDGRTDGDGRTNGDGRTDGWILVFIIRYLKVSSAFYPFG